MRSLIRVTMQSLHVLAQLDFVSGATVMAQASVVRPSPVRPSVNSGFSKTAAWIQAKFCGKLTIRHTPDVFFFKIHNFLIFMIFCFVFVNMGLYGSQHFKTLLLPQFRSDFKQTL